MEDMESLRIGAQVLRSQLGISSGPVDFLRVNLGQFILDLLGCDGKFIRNIEDC
jgi:hypothetical protein